MREFTYTALPGRVVFGVGAARKRLAEEVERLGATSVLLIAAEPELALARDLAAALPVTGEFSGVRPHVPIEVARAATEAAAGVDLLLSVGGGSTTGTAKAVALETGLPIAAVPTTYAGSEMTPVWGRTEQRRKTTGVDRRVLPQLVVYDPELTTSLPAHITGPSAINALAHSVEAFYAPGANPITTVIARESIRALAGWLPLAVSRPDDLQARGETLYGAYLAGAAFAVAGSGLHHKICHVLGGAYDLPHADTHTVVLPYVTAFQTPALPEEMEAIAGAIGDLAMDSSPAHGLHVLAQLVGAPTALRDIGMREEDLEEAAGLVLEKVPADNPRPVDKDDVRRLLRAAFDGEEPQ